MCPPVETVKVNESVNKTLLTYHNREAQGNGGRLHKAKVTKANKPEQNGGRSILIQNSTAECLANENSSVPVDTNAVMKGIRRNDRHHRANTTLYK